jgi:flagellar export protein FliJ
VKQHSFNKVIQVRTIQQKQAQQQVADAVRTRIEEEERLSTIHEHRKTAASAIRAKQKMSVAQMQTMRSHLSSLTKDIETQQETVTKASAKEGEKRDALIKKSQEKKMIEVLNDKRLKSERKESDRKEQKTLDEFSQRLR